MDAEFDLLPWTSAVAEKLNRFAAGFPEASIYHHPVWSELLRAVYGGRLFLATVWRQRALSAVAPILELRNPVFGNDGQFYFASDKTGISNIYSCNLKDKE